MNAVGYRAYRDFLLRPVGKQGPENLLAHFSMELAHSIDLTAAANRKICHVEGLRIVFRILPSHGEQVIHRYCKLIHCVVAQIRANEFGIEAVEACTDGGVRGEYITGPRDSDGKIEWLLVFLHVGACSFKRGKRCMAFVEMANIRLQSNCPQQTPTSDAEDNLLLQAHLCVAAIELTGNSRSEEHTS